MRAKREACPTSARFENGLPAALLPNGHAPAFNNRLPAALLPKGHAPAFSTYRNRAPEPDPLDPLLVRCKAPNLSVRSCMPSIARETSSMLPEAT